MEKFKVVKAQLMMKVAGFILQVHTNPVKRVLAKSAAWINRKQYGNNALDFLEHEESIDIMEDSQYERTINEKSDHLG